MKILWKYLKPQRGLVLISLLLAGVAQILSLVDPVIFGKIIDNYANNRGDRTADELIKGITWWLVIALVVALLPALPKLFRNIQHGWPCKNLGCTFLTKA